MLYKKNSDKTLSDELFKDPTCEYRAAPFWAWNCKLDKGLLKRQIGYFKEMGFGGFHMHSRTGMGTPYLSDEFMDMVRFCVEEARSRDMLAWLYDEDRFPSGSAGGIVTKNPKYRCRYILFTKKHRETLPKDEAIENGGAYTVARFNVTLNEDGTLKEYKKCADGEWAVYCLTKESSPWYNNETYVDTLNKEAIDEFIRVTHERYKEVVGYAFDSIIPAIFTDEPQFEKKETLGNAFEDGDVKLPWTYDIEDTYAEAYGGSDITDTIPELVWDLPGGKASQARYRFHDHIAERFARAFADNIGAWCRKNGIYLTGHVMEEHMLIAQTHSTGDTMRSYRSFGIPGIDMLCDAYEYTTLKQVQSAVNQYGSEAQLSEIYGVTDWDFDFRGHKFQGDWQAALGVSVRVPHLAFLSMEGEGKRDYPASISYQSPWYKEYKKIEDHYARINTAMVRGVPVVNVAVIHPVESYWLHWGPERETHDIRWEAERRFGDITEWLLFSCTDFDFICESLLPGQYESSSDGRLHVGKMSYSAVVVPACETLRSTTVKALSEFRKKGGRLIFMGDCPSYIDAAQDEEGILRRLYDDSAVIPYEKEPLVRALENERKTEIEGADNIFCRMREDTDCRWLFAAHGTKPENKDIPNRQCVTFKIKGLYKPVLYDTMSGDIKDMPYSMDEENKMTYIKAVMYDYDSLLIKLCKRQVRPYNLRCTFSEPNVFLMDTAEYAFDDGGYSAEEEILRIDNKFREYLGWPERQGYYAQPWTVPEEKPSHILRLRMRFESDICVRGALLAAEHADMLTVRLNGNICRHPEEYGYFTDEAILTLPLPEIREGVNVLEIELPFGKRLGAEWFYILGDFGVSLNGRTKRITHKADEMRFGSLTEMKMPFYGANVTYEMDFTLESPSDISVRLPAYRGALVKLSIDGSEAGMLTFSPYKLRVTGLEAGRHTAAFELFGNRYNSFGALHNADTGNKWIDAMAWRTQGDKWTYDYMVRQLGILGEPEILLTE